MPLLLPASELLHCLYRVCLFFKTRHRQNHHQAVCEISRTISCSYLLDIFTVTSVVVITIMMVVV